MGGTYQELYKTDEVTALSWWKALPADYVVFRYNPINGELFGPEVVGEYNAQFGVGWKVYKTGNLSSAVRVSACQPKRWPANDWRIGVLWHGNKRHEPQLCVAYAKDVNQCLIAMGAKPVVEW
jgi:hypothetical protein